MPSPRRRYQEDINAGILQPDSAQKRAVLEFERIYHDIQRNRTWWHRLIARRRDQPVTGLYLWGGVGRGKTHLMDLFYDTLAVGKKRLHFHRLMQMIHQQLTQLKGEKNPLSAITARLAADTQVLCIDEFVVIDIGDAMLLAGLLENLSAHRICLVATSNIIPNQLYRDGLQRQRFLPAIDWIVQHTHTLHLDSDTDYRLRTLQKVELFHSPLDDKAEENLYHSFHELAPEKGSSNQTIEILGRSLSYRYRADDVIWFDFCTICEGERSQHDYIELAKEYHAILIGNIPALGNDKNDAARRFILMIDEFYDRRVKLILTSALPIDQIYQGTRLKHDFQRTYSRLHEMQTHHYLSQPHLP